MTKLALYVPLQAKPGKEKEVADFLRSALPLVNAEPGTISWFAIQEGPSAFAIFDTFDDEAGRDAHLNGKVAAALMEKAKAGDLFAKTPEIYKLEISRTNCQNERPPAPVVAISAATQKTTRVPDRMDAGPKNGPTPKGLVRGSADAWRSPGVALGLIASALICPKRRRPSRSSWDSVPQERCREQPIRPRRPPRWPLSSPRS